MYNPFPTYTCIRTQIISPVFLIWRKMKANEIGFQNTLEINTCQDNIWLFSMLSDHQDEVLQRSFWIINVCN